LARYRYRASPYPGQIVTFYAAKKPDKVAQRMETEWSGLALGGVEHCTVPGNHSTLLNEPNVQVLVEYLNEYLSEVEPV
jgi:thioesterase domain-containing protein